MKLLHNIGNINHPNYTTREKILACSDELGFDGIYYSVYENQDVLAGKSGIFFVMGDYVGKDNSFDLPNVPKLEKYCNWEEINELAERFSFKIGWHTWSHRDLTKLSDEEVIKEITPPFPMKYFAYPYGKYDDRIVSLVKNAGYENAWSVTQGNEEPLTLRRDYL